MEGSQRPDCNIFCLQETHFAAQKMPSFSHKIFPHIFTSNAPSIKRGVLIAIRETVNFKLIASETDTQGQYVVLICQIKNTMYSIINVPPQHQAHFVSAENLEEDTTFMPRSHYPVWGFQHSAK